MTESLLLGLALIAIGAAAFFAYRAAKAQEIAATAKARFEGVDMIRQERDRAVAELAELRKENMRIAADLATERGGAAARAAAIEEQQKTLKDTFGALAAQALDDSQKRFMAVADETFKRHSEAAKGGVKEVMTPTQEALAKLTLTVDQMEKARLQDKSTLGEQMRHIGDTLKETQNVTGKLAHALRQSPKARGRWGEHSLRNSLEMGGLQAKVDFDEQTSVDGDGGKLRPDVVIRVPGGRSVIVDSKVAISAFLDAIDAADETAREAKLRQHATELKAHVKALSSKEYWKHVPDTVDFVIMFVPGDNLLHEALEREPSLQEEAFACKVIIASPTTMVALARTIAFGWRQEQSAKNAQEIAALGRLLYERISVMGDHIVKVGDAINKSVTAYNGMVTSIDSRVLVTARKFKELGAADAGVEIAEVKQIDIQPKALAPPEQLELTPLSDAKKRVR